MAGLTLEIDSTWDGRPVGLDERVVMTLTADADALILEVQAPLHGDPPPPAPPGPTWGLWEHEVVELFVAGSGEEYTEIEIGPGGHHLVLRLKGRREVVERELPLALEVERDGASWRATARLDRTLLPPPPHHINAYAIHGVGPRRRYLAWRPVPGDTPDFHRLECFEPVEL